MSRSGGHGYRISGLEKLRNPNRAEAVALATRPPICGELLGSPLCEPVTAVEIGVRAATVHPVNTETIENMTIRPC